MMGRLEELRNDYEKAIEKKESYKAKLALVSDDIDTISKEIRNLEQLEKTSGSIAGDIFSFIDEDGNYMYFRLINVPKGCYDFMIESETDEFESYTILGYKYKYVESLVDAVCSDLYLKLIDVSK